MPLKKRAPPKPRPRTRTFSGCLTCRHRKVRCDLNKPTCNNCARLQLRCPGYESQFYWLPQWHEAEEPNQPALDGEQTDAAAAATHSRMRTEIFSERYRESMAASIVYQVMSTLSPAACELEQILDDLEAQAMEIQSIHDTLSWELQKGPFGVFPSLSHVDNSSLSRSQACEPALKDDGNATDQVQVTGATFNDLSIWDELNPLTTTSEFPELDFLDEWSFPGDPPELRAGETNSPPATQGPPSAPMLTTTFEGSQSLGGLENDQQEQQSVSTQQASVAVAAAGAPNHGIPPSPSNSAIPEPSSPYLPRNARYLLWHYATHTIPSLSGMPHAREEAPWNELHLPYALKAYAELNVLGDSSLAGVSLLYSLLSISCFQLHTLHTDGLLGDGNSTTLATSDKQAPSGAWKAEAHKFRKIAETAFRKCLDGISGGKANTKYKAILLAAMNIVCTRIISGETLDARNHILQCEDLVRVMGSDLKKRHSRKTMVLHRMFLFIQVFEAASSYQPPNPPDIGSSVAQFHHPYQIEQDIRKTQEIIEGRKTPHTYPHPQSSFLGRVSIEELGLDEDEDAPYKSLEPYGVPFSLLCLIATTTNLITDIERCGTFPSSHLPAELEHRAQMLENGICAWGAASGRTNGKPGLVSNEAAAVACVDLSLSPRRCTLDCPDQVDLSNGPDDTGATAVPELMHRCMSTAVHHALLIYYFRTVRDTNPVILQHYVESIIDSLEEHARHKVRYAPARLNVIVWPSFIAACEAIGVTLRQRCINCLRHAAWAGFRNWEAAEGLVREVWKRRDITSSANATTSWRNVMRESGLSMVLT